MTQFVQLHLLAAYPPSNPNRDDTGRPKTAMVGGSQRQRISSQSLKRAWRTSEIFKQALDAHIGKQTQRIGIEWIYPKLIEAGYPDADARQWSLKIQKVYGKPAEKKKDKLNAALLNGQVVKITPEEEVALHDLVRELGLHKQGKASESYRSFFNELDELAKKKTKKTKKDESGEESEEEDEKSKSPTSLLKAKLLHKEHTAADIALFGRMLADAPLYNTEAACQVAHAFTVHKVALEDDFFTAVDDLNDHREDSGSAYMGEVGFGSGVYYLYLCVDTYRLKENLRVSGNTDLARTTLEALLESAATVAPSGMQNRFGNRVAASYILVERGNQQPRSLAAAFFKPINGDGWIEPSVEALEKTLGNMDKVYGSRADARQKINSITGEGSKWKADATSEWESIKLKESETHLDSLKRFVGGVYDA